MNWKQFDEYMNSKGDIGKPKVDAHGDQVDPMKSPNSPPNGKKPYVADGHKNSKKPLGDQGDEDLVYEPKTTYGKEGKVAKIPTAEFAQYELVPLISEAIKQNPLIVETIVNDLRRQGLLGPFIAELLQHRETYQHLAELMMNENYGPSIRQRLAREEVTLRHPAKGSEQETPDLEDMGQDDSEIDDDDLDMDMDMDDQPEPKPAVQPTGGAQQEPNPMQKVYKSMMRKW